MAIVDVIEHVLLLKVRPNTPLNKQMEMVDNLNKLTSIPGVLHLNAAPVMSSWSAHKALAQGFTHVLHSRHQNKAALQVFAYHPLQIYTMDKYVHPIIIRHKGEQGLLAIDWESRVEKYVDMIYRAKRIVLCKLKDEVCGDGRIRLVSEITAAAKDSKFTSGGDNFSPVKAWGYDFGYISFFREPQDLDEVTNGPDEVWSKVEGGPYVDKFILIDYENETGRHPDNSPLAELDI